MSAYTDTVKAREALAKAKTTSDPEARLRALETATEALADAISELNWGDERTARENKRRFGG